MVRVCVFDGETEGVCSRQKDQRRRIYTLVWKHENTAHRRKKKKRWVSAVLWLLAFPRESSPNFPCIAWDLNVI